MEGHGEMGLFQENFDPSMIARMRDDGYESRSGSDNVEGASGDDQDAGDDQRPKKKKYHRHTPQQIQELEAFFKECPHPDEKQRLELSRRLGLETKQIKFWFQNRRTQMKTQLERHDHIILKQEYEKLKNDNDALRTAMANPVCNSCGGPAIPGQISFDDHQLRIENARLKDELNRICTLANKFLGRPISSIPIPSSNSSFDLVVGRNGIGGTPLTMGLDLGNGFLSTTSSAMSLSKPPLGLMDHEASINRSMLVNLALTAMDELIKMAHTDSPLWIKSFDGGKEILNLEEYSRTFSPCIGTKPTGFVTEATRDVGMVMINSLTLVDALMDEAQWKQMFPCTIARAATIDMISSGVAGIRNGALHVMHAELQVLSPLVPVRQLKFLRFCKQQAQGVWAVVDVSLDISQESTKANPLVSCRRLPSGFVVQDMSNGYSKVTWVEHSEYDESSIHPLYRPFISSGMGFGAQRWVATLQRQCEFLAILMPSSLPKEDPTALNLAGRTSMLQLAQRMTDNFCSGVCASTARKWDTLRVGNVGEDVRVMTRKNLDDPGEPPGIVLSAATSIWMPVAQQRLFDFLRDDRLRSEWDILSTGRPIQEMIHIAKGHKHGNCVSLLRGSPTTANESSMLILQETWTDASGSLVVYAPVDIPSINVVMAGGDPAYVALLPSGFAILPDERSGNCDGAMSKAGENVTDGGGGCLLTVGFQILLDSQPTAKLTVESVETVNNLITCTIQKIKAALKLT
ncbi:homeobox-leucine zipper protein ANTHOCYANINLESS 2-like isoform X2 [Corylus avellana]|nr:homeobox-leucine zipper protein ANTHOCYANINLESS 2-like isoform X2 [Corylus avellana]XP_059452017.1 homeobox-leucine zipper protein ANTHOCYANINLESS 2-like isoform X2 [Corylus avellana]XP_059452018.1 homeobox-leucine zipper protein ANTHOCYANINLESS 2-like isoform X2 [Corylus avellana]